MAEEYVTLAGDFDLVAKSDAEQNIFGWAILSKRANGSLVLDHQGDVVDIEDLEGAAYDFVLDHRATGDMHRGDAHGRMIESFVFTPEKIEKMGLPEGSVPLGWWVGFHIDDTEAYESVRKGKRSMFSIEGTGVREPIEVDVEVKED